MTRADSYPIVSVLIPARNEGTRIAACLESILANDYPPDRLELFVIDGASDDATRVVAERYARRHMCLKILDNPSRIIPAAMNIGIAQARGEIIMKVDAHSRYPRDYVGRCVRALLEHGADCAGGIWKIAPGADTAIGRAIADSLSHPFASGNAYVKVGAREPRWTDTVAFGCYRREVFSRIGGYNEDLAGSSDLDLNTRLRQAGGRILLVPKIAVEYFADPDLRRFWQHNFADGVWATYVLKFRSPAWRWRHWIPLVLILSLLFSLGLSIVWPYARWLLAAIAGVYGLMNLVAAVHLAAEKRSASDMWAAPMVFATRHVAHGLGALYGLGLVLVPGKRWRGRRTAAT